MARANRTAQATAGAAQAVAALALRELRADADETVAGYVAMDAELDPAPLMAGLAKRGHSLCLPCVVARGQPLVFRRYRPGDKLVPGPFGTREPLNTANAVRPTLLLIPLLAFDRRGFRLGYGGGYYDRTLRDLRALGPSRQAPLRAVGLGYGFQEIAELPHEDWDERLDMIVTETEFIRAGAVS